LAQPLAVLEQAGHKFQTQANEVMKYIQDHRGELSRDVLVRLPRHPRSILHRCLVGGSGIQLSLY
jgi:hypothetical protein